MYFSHFSFITLLELYTAQIRNCKVQYIIQYLFIYLYIYLFRKGILIQDRALVFCIMRLALL